MWAHLLGKQRNRSSQGYENLTAEESAVLSRWDALREPPQPVIKQEHSVDQPDTSGLVGAVQAEEVNGAPTVKT